MIDPVVGCCRRDQELGGRRIGCQEMGLQEASSRIYEVQKVERGNMAREGRRLSLNRVHPQLPAPREDLVEQGKHVPISPTWNDE